MANLAKLGDLIPIFEGARAISKVSKPVQGQVGNGIPGNTQKPVFTPLKEPKTAILGPWRASLANLGAQLPIVEGVQLTWGLSNKNLMGLGLKRAETAKKNVFRPFLEISER